LGDDVAPTSLNEGRGKVVVPKLVVALHLKLKRRLVDGWAGAGGTRGRASRLPKCGKAETFHFGKGGEMGFPGT